MRFIRALAVPLAALLLAGLASPPPAQAEELWINMVAATSVEDAPPMGLFAKQPWTIAGMLFKSGKWQAEKGSTYSKLHLYADREFVFGGVEIKTCGQNLEDQVTVFINFDERVYRLQPAAAGSALRYLAEGQDKPKARSVTLNFGKTHDVCVSAVTLLDANHDAYGIRVPRIVAGKAAASSTTKPVEAYDVMNLFDSRYESGWASNAKSVGERLDFTFDEPQTVTMLKIWNGYQRSDQHCYENVRVKTMDVEGDGGYKTTLEVQDVMGSQDLALPKPFTGKHLRLVVKDAYKGKTYQDLVITELRFFDGKEWFTLDPFPRIRQTAAQNRAAFAKVGLEGALNRELNGRLPPVDVDDDDQNSPFVVAANFRFRADGSFYFEGNDRDGHPTVSGTDRFINALGNYEVRTVTADHIEVRVFGLFRFREANDHSGDCNGCGRDCNKPGTERIAHDLTDPDGDKVGVEYETRRQQIFQEVFRFTRKTRPNGETFVKAESTGKKRFLIPRDRVTGKGRTLELAIVE